eukprot:gene6670-10834_t
MRVTVLTLFTVVLSLKLSSGYAQILDLGCHIWKNSWIKIQQNNNFERSFTFTVNSKPRNGWIGVGFFSKKDDFSSSFSVIGYLPNNFLQLQNHTDVTKEKTIFDYKFQDDLYNTIDQKVTFSFKLNSTKLLGKNYILLSQSTEASPVAYNNTTHIPRHNSMSNYIKFEFNVSKTSENKNHLLCVDELNLAGRIMSANWYTFAFGTIFYVSLFILVVAFRNDQPLHSRFVSPHITIFAYYTNFISERIYSMLDIETSSKIYCELGAFIGYAAVQIAFAAPTLMIFRYLILLRLHENKRRITKKLKVKEVFVDQKIRKLFTKILKYLASPWIIILFPIFWLLAFESMLFIVYFYHNFVCTEDAWFYMKVLNTLFILVTFSNIACFLTFDLISNLPAMFKCHWRHVFFHSDPYHYRLDMIFTFFAVIPMIAWFAAPLPYFFGSFLAEYVFFTGFWVTGLQSLVITIIKKLFFSYKTSNSNNAKLKVEDVLKPKILDIFIDYCEMEWSSENIFLKLDILSYKKTKSLKERENLCWIIKERYLLSGVSPLEVNCPGNILSKAVKGIDEKSFVDELLNEVESEIDRNLLDTISRFRVSKLYEILLKDLKNQEQTLGL